MNLTEKKDFIIKQLENIQDEVMMDGIIEYITVKNSTESINNSDINFSIIEQIMNEREDVLGKLAQ